MSKEYILQSLAETYKKIEGLRGLHLPVTLQAIENYEKAGVEEFFLEQQRVKLQKINDQIEELEQKAHRLMLRLNSE